MARVVRSSRVEADLIEIWLFVADDSVKSADAVLDEIDAACRLLAENPRLGAMREEVATNLRSWPVGNYVIFYRAAVDGIEVARVLHGARDLPRFFA